MSIVGKGAIGISVIFWIIRIVATYLFHMGYTYAIQPMNLTFEIILLFVYFLSLLFILKKNIFGAFLYFFSYIAYFGVDMYKQINVLVTEGAVTNSYISLMMSFLGVIIPLIILVDFLVNKNKASIVTNKKTDWFYTNEDYDRKKDARDDDNQYKL